MSCGVIRTSLVPFALPRPADGPVQDVVHAEIGGDRRHGLALAVVLIRARARDDAEARERREAARDLLRDAGAKY
jgi:hypothetical protein